MTAVTLGGLEAAAGVRGDGLTGLVNDTPELALLDVDTNGLSVALDIVGTAFVVDTDFVVDTAPGPRSPTRFRSVTRPEESNPYSWMPLAVA
ncbi:hypothetical protein ACWDUD_18030 [Rhodococcus sp. NPDC003382]